MLYFRAPILTFLLSLPLFTVAQTQKLTGKVVAISDGDTLTVLDGNRTQHKIRLSGIDAPEKAQAFGEASKKNLSALVFGKLVSVEYSKRDRYGRTVGRVLVENTDICLEQLKAGLAWHYTKYEAEQPPAEREQYKKAEAEARAAKQGLWRDPSPVAPWNFRHPNESTSREGNTSPQENKAEAGEVRGNKKSRIFHTPECKDYDRIAPENRVIFKTEAEATKAGFRKARNCER